MLQEPNLLPLSAYPFHIQIEFCKGGATQVWFGLCVIAHDLGNCPPMIRLGPILGPGCSACQLAELWGQV